jgi:plasmid stability protein
MAQLIVRRLEKEVVQKLREQAAKYGVSMEEQHRRILRKKLLAKRKSPAKPKVKNKPKMSFSEFLVAPPYIDFDLMDYIPKRGMPRPVNLE